MNYYEELEQTLWKRCRDQNHVELALLLDGCWWSFVRSEKPEYKFEISNLNQSLGEDKPKELNSFGMRLRLQREPKGPDEMKRVLLDHRVRIVHHEKTNLPLVVDFLHATPLPGELSVRSFAVSYNDFGVNKVFRNVDGYRDGLRFISDIHKFLTTGERPVV